MVMWKTRKTDENMFNVYNSDKLFIYDEMRFGVIHRSFCPYAYTCELD